MDFKQLEAFVATIDYNSFSEAARKLYLTQPTISAHINALESELNTKLINRTTKKMELTSRGEQFYDFASSVLTMKNNIIKEFTGSGQKFISLGASTIPSSYILPEILGKYRLVDPDVEFHIWQSDSKKVLNRVMEGTLDFGLVGSTFDAEDCVFIPFYTDTLVLAAPNNEYFSKLKKNQTPIAALLKEPMILRENGSGTQKAMSEYLAANNIDITQLNCILHINDLEALKRLISNGAGTSIVSKKSIEDLVETGKIIEFPLGMKKNLRNLYIVYNKHKIQKAHVKQIIRFIKNFYNDTPESAQRADMS